MVDDAELRAWFCGEVLPLERALVSFIKRNWRVHEDVTDIRQEVYEAALTGAQKALPDNAAAYVFTIARNNLINKARRARIVSFELVADLEMHVLADFTAAENAHVARDELKRALQGINQLPPRCREVVRLRKVEGYSTRETAAKLNVTTHTVEKQLTLGMRALCDFMLGGQGKVKRHGVALPILRKRDV